MLHSLLSIRNKTTSLSVSQLSMSKNHIQTLGTLLINTSKHKKRDQFRKNELMKTVVYQHFLTS